MGRQNSSSHFVLSAQHQPLLLAVADQATTQCNNTALAFGFINTVASAAPFAWLSNRRAGGAQLPFARVGSSSIWDPPASADTLMKQLLSEEPDEPQGPRRGHTDEWYQQRCIFCASCKATINSHYQKKGSRCQGCRRWFHTACMPATAPSSSTAAGGSEAEGDAAAAATAGSGQSQSADAANSTSGSSRRVKRQRNLFFHDEDCMQVHGRLAVVAAAGDQPFTLPDRRPFWEKLLSPADPNAAATWRLLDLSDVKGLYKDAQKRDTLFKQHKKAQRQLEAAAAAAAKREEAARRNRGFGLGSSSSKQDGAAAADGKDGAEVGVGAGRGGRLPSSLDDFLLVSEVLKPLGETPRDLLEDSYAIITRVGSDGPAAVATLNVYGSDHARLQGVATPPYLQRQGQATRLLQQLERVLGDVGVEELVVILEPQVDDKHTKRNPLLLPADKAQQWFMRRLGFRSASSEQQMLWRRELPEYHKGLVAGCSLLVKPLPGAAGQGRAKK